MALPKKPLPRPSLKLVLDPSSDREYIHFEGSQLAPFEPAATAMSRVNTWWLADASLLTYWDETEAGRRFLSANLQSKLIQDPGTDTECYIAWGDAFVIVAFRGTEADSLHDIGSDLNFFLEGWDQLPGERVHRGFRDALNGVWNRIVEVDALKGRGVWFTGHSLGAALATLAGDRFRRERDGLGLGELRGIYTFGSPLVGDRGFVEGFNSRCGDRSFRFVNDRDAVTRVPPAALGYRHVNSERFIGFDDPDVLFISEPVIDHTPRRYSVLAWNTID